MLEPAAVIDRHPHQRQCVLESLPERPGSISGRQPGTVSPEELDTELGLERPHALADRGRSDAEFRGRQKKIAVPDTGREYAQRFQGRQGITHAFI
jgi:hypothetical protein